MNHSDLRVIKTKSALSQSLFTLLDKKEFSGITVNQICEDALVHRTTFYKHFYDKYDLLIYLVTDLTNGFFSADISDRINKPFSTMFESFTNVKFLERISRKQENDRELEETLVNHFITVLQNDIKKNEHRITVDDKIPSELIFYIYGSTLHGIMSWKNDYNMDLSPHELDKIYHTLINIKVQDD